MEHQITIENKGETVFASLDDTIRIELEENPTTGYSWVLEQETPMFLIVSNNYHLPKGRGVGARGMRTIILKIVQNGNSQINLKNWQRWSGSVYQTIELFVEVR